MPTISKGTAKVVAYKKESGGWGVIPVPATGAKQLRRVTSSFNLIKETYESGEIRTDRQVADFRHGVRSAEGSLEGELSAGSYSDFMQSIVGRDFASVTAISSLTLTIAATVHPQYTITRSTGSWITDGVKVGNVIRLTGGTLNAANIDKNLLVLSMTATVLTIQVLNSVAMVAQSAIASCTATVTGKTTFVPSSSHTDDSYSVEEWYSDITQSEVYTGVKVNSMQVQMPATGLATVSFGFVGKDLGSTGITQYYSSPTAQGTTGVLAAVNGIMLVAGAPVALVTSADLTVERATENATAVGSNSIAEIFTGRIRASGNLSVYFQDATFRDYFDDETAVSIVFALTQDNTAASNVISITLPKVKLGSFTKDDGELGLVAQTSFTALLNDVTTAGLNATTVQIQDTSI